MVPEVGADGPRRSHRLRVAPRTRPMVPRSQARWRNRRAWGSTRTPVRARSRGLLRCRFTSSLKALASLSMGWQGTAWVRRDRGKPAAGLAAKRAAWRVGRHQLRMRGLQRYQLAHQRVVVGVRNVRIVQRPAVVGVDVRARSSAARAAGSGAGRSCSVLLPLAVQPATPPTRLARCAAVRRAHPPGVLPWCMKRHGPPFPHSDRAYDRWRQAGPRIRKAPRATRSPFPDEEATSPPCSKANLRQGDRGQKLAARCRTCPARLPAGIRFPRRLRGSAWRCRRLAPSAAVKAGGIHATYLVDSDKGKLARACEGAGAARRGRHRTLPPGQKTQQPYRRALRLRPLATASARPSPESSARHRQQKVKAALDATLELAPDIAEARTFGGTSASITRKSSAEWQRHASPTAPARQA